LEPNYRRIAEPRRHREKVSVASKSFGLRSECGLVLDIHAHRLPEAKVRVFIRELQDDPVRLARGFDTQNTEPVSTELHVLGQAS
jgi:hypothetical protein